MPTGIDGLALVLASSRGLGRAAARALTRAGLEVLLHSRTARDAEADGSRMLGWDLSTPGATRAGIQRMLDDGLKPNVLVCNCGGPSPGSFDEVSREQWDATFQAILFSVIEAVTTLRPVMREAGWGRIVIISSTSAKEPIPELVLSSVPRAALSSLVKCLAPKLAVDQITINLGLPGYFQTDRLLAFGDALDGIQDRIPGNRFGQPEELASLITFLASRDAAYITSQAIVCDGGLVRSL